MKNVTSGITPLDLADVECERFAAVALDHAASATRAWSRSNRRPPALSAREGLRAVAFESLVVLLCANDIADGRALSPKDSARLAVAARRIDAICDEALR